MWGPAGKGVPARLSGGARRLCAGQGAAGARRGVGTAAWPARRAETSSSAAEREGTQGNQGQEGGAAVPPVGSSGGAAGGAAQARARWTSWPPAELPTGSFLPRCRNHSPPCRLGETAPQICLSPWADRRFGYRRRAPRPNRSNPVKGYAHERARAGRAVLESCSSRAQHMTSGRPPRRAGYIGSQNGFTKRHGGLYG